MLIDEFAAGWLAQLDSWASEAENDLYLLIDGVFVPGLQRSFIGLVGAQSVSLLFASLPGCSDAVKDASPFVLPYQQGNPAFQRLLARCSGWPMVSAIATSETLAQLAERLAAWCVVENGGQKFNFRFPDTRRLPGIFHALDPRQRGEMAGPVRRWNYIGRTGDWQSLQLAGEARPAGERPQKLNDGQFGIMVSDSEIDEMMVRLGHRGCQPSGKPSASHAIVAQAMSAAHAQRLESTRHLDWCMACMRRGTLMESAQAMAALDLWRATAA